MTLFSFPGSNNGTFSSPFVTLYHAQSAHVYRTKTEISGEFLKGKQTVLLFLSDFSETQQNKLTKLAQHFQNTIHFHPGHPVHIISILV